MVSNEKDLVFTSNRGEKTIGIFPQDHDKKLEKVTVGGYPNGLAFDPSHGQLLAANVPRQDDPTPITASIVDAVTKNLTADIVVPGRTRWTVFDQKTDRFYVNIAKPSQIVAIDSKDLDGISATYDIPATGPHGLDLDNSGRRLFCACDNRSLFTLDLESARVARVGTLSGTPDVIFYNDQRQHLYVAVGDPGLVDVFDTRRMKFAETVKTEKGAHTIAYNPETSKVYALLPETHRASVFVDE